MLVLRKAANVRIIEGVYLYPGVNGNVPKSLLQNESFNEEVELGILQLMSQDDEEEKIKTTADVPDEGVIMAILKAKSGEAIKLVRNTLKIKTIDALAEKETRGPVLDAIRAQQQLLFVPPKEEKKDKKEETF
jgi:hypothetical protein